MQNKRENIIVSGCTKGIGRAVVELFAEKGFDVIGCARNENDLKSLSDLLKEKYPQQNFWFSVCDMSKKEQVLAFAEKINTDVGCVDIIVNNAGVFLPGKLIDEVDGTLEKLLATNVQSAYYLTRSLLSAMIKQKKGHIFNMGSVAGIQPYENGGSYCISKFALIGFSKQLREELKPYNVKVTTVIPGATLTDSWKGVNLPAERFIPAEDIAQNILDIYNLSDRTNIEEVIIRPQLGDI